MKAALIGHGTIAKLALATLERELPEPFEYLAIYARPSGLERARALAEHFGASLARRFVVTSDLAEIIAVRPAFAAEAAGHEALHTTGATLLEAGADLIVTSVGALADGDLRRRLDEAARKGQSGYSAISGAIGGLDILAAAKLAGLESVVYTGRKPPAAWKGTRAEALADLDALTHELLLYEGPADAAARDYPQNANVAATLALAGAGFEKTRVRLIADPAITRNVHEIAVRSSCADFSFRVEGKPAHDNPKTSLTVGYSLAATILQRVRLNRQG